MLKEWKEDIEKLVKHINPNRQENGIHGIPFNGCNKKLNGLLSTITIRHRSFDRQERSLTCSRYSLFSHRMKIYQNKQSNLE
ncbi:hypothetical protein WN944_015732 [Citrus x changshan-huyou]|uniref:Uncharacterized protein n=1 Tax=Citrus x changshan-huyou TaxID=2935761 RepID=A0AAP0M9J3_9ROSI